VEWANFIVQFYIGNEFVKIIGASARSMLFMEGRMAPSTGGSSSTALGISRDKIFGIFLRRKFQGED